MAPPVYFGPDTHLPGMGGGGAPTNMRGGVEGFGVAYTPMPDVFISADDPPPPIRTETTLTPDDEGSFPDRFICQVGVSVCIFPEEAFGDMSPADVRAYERCVINRGRLKVLSGSGGNQKILATIPFVQANVSTFFPKGGERVNIYPMDGVWSGTRFVAEYPCLPRPEDNLIIKTQLVLTYCIRGRDDRERDRIGERYQQPRSLPRNDQRGPHRQVHGSPLWLGRRIRSAPAPSVDVRLRGYRVGGDGKSSERPFPWSLPTRDTRYTG